MRKYSRNIPQKVIAHLNETVRYKPFVTGSYFIDHDINICHDVLRGDKLGSQTNSKRKNNLIKKEIGENVIIYFNDLQHIFPNKKTSSLYWDVSKLVSGGYLFRVRNGVYKLNVRESSITKLISSNAKKAVKIMEETGYVFYVFGIGILAKYLHHIHETYKVIMFIEKYSIDEIFRTLTERSIHVVRSVKEAASYDYRNFNDSRSMIMLLETDSFIYFKDHYATVEKAFLDLYYEITRNGYPLALQELARTYRNMVRNGVIDQKKLL